MVHRVDDKDLRILEVLRDHGEYTTRQISRKTGLPATTIHNRIRQLKSEGIICRFTIDLNYQRINRSFVAYVLISANLQMLKQHNKTQHDLAREISKFNFVERADIVSGGTDLVALVRVKDVAEFDEVLLNKLQLIEGIEKTQSLIVLHEG